MWWESSGASRRRPRHLCLCTGVRIQLKTTHKRANNSREFSVCRANLCFVFNGALRGWKRVQIIEGLLEVWMCGRLMSWWKFGGCWVLSWALTYRKLMFSLGLGLLKLWWELQDYLVLWRSDTYFCVRNPFAFNNIVVQRIQC